MNVSSSNFFFCKCFLSKLYYVFWFTHSTILEAATYIK